MKDNYCKIIKKDGRLVLVMPNGEEVPKQLDIMACQDTDMVGSNCGLVDVTVTVRAMIKDDN